MTKKKEPPTPPPPDPPVNGDVSAANEPPQSVEQRALDIYVRHAREGNADRNGLAPEALAEIMAMVEADETLHCRAIRKYAQELLWDSQARCREVIHRPPSHWRDPVVFPAQVHEHVHFAVGKYLSWPLMSGKLLQYATKKDLENEIDARRMKAASHDKVAAFFAAVVKQLKNEAQTVKEVLDEEALGRLMENAKDATSKKFGLDRARL